MRRLISLFCFCAFLLACLPSAHADDWPMWGGDPARNMVAADESIPDDFEPGELNFRTEKVEPNTTKYVRWITKLGSQSYGNTTVANGRVYVGTNNESPRDPRHKGDRGVVMCFDEKTGDLKWQLVVPKLGAGKVSDWEYLGICSSPVVDGDRVYVVTNACHVVCLDVNGHADGNQGYKEEAKFMETEDVGELDADILWVYDMRVQVGSFPHNVTSTSAMIVGDRVYVATSNGVDYSHTKIRKPLAPALIALDKMTGKLVGEEGAGISRRTLHSNWSSPAAITSGEKNTIVFGAGDGFVYFFDPETERIIEGGEPFDIFPVLGKVAGNPDSYWKDAEGNPIRYATAPGPSEFIATPVIADGMVYASIGQDPEHGEGVGALTCIDPAKLGTNDAIVWRNTDVDRSISTVAVHEGIVYHADYTGYLRALDAKTGKMLWEHDTEAHIWSSPLVADGKVYLGDEDGVLHVLEAGREYKLLRHVEFEVPIYSSAVAANDTLYIATQTHLFAIGKDDVK